MGDYMRKIRDVALDLGVRDIDVYGDYKAKINDFPLKKRGKLILITATSPTPYGEGKTTLSIGLNDALNSLGYKSVVCLREPSLGPVFGIKGGATGGGKSMVVPSDEINLHFTGDIHAVTSANNLLCAAIDNHIFQGNELRINPETICFGRCLDMNDRALRDVRLGNREEHFCISVASELMAILCLASSLDDLKRRINNIYFADDMDGKPLFVSDLEVGEAMTILLKDAFKPNLVQTLEGNPAIIHGGPFANIAHGCNSIKATKMGLSLADYVITEAGFGSDLGAEKFMDIKCREGELKPDVIVINTTIRSLKYNGGLDKSLLKEESIDFLRKGLANLKVHILNMKKFLDNVIVCANKFDFDTDREIDLVRDFVLNMGCEFSVSSAYSDGSAGATDLGRKVVRLANNDKVFNFMYDLNDSIYDKVLSLTSNIYHADKVVYSDRAKEKIDKFERMGFGNLEVCVAKTQYSLSDDPKKLGFPRGFEMYVSDVKLCSGAGFIVIYMGGVMVMPGLSKSPAYLNMHIDDDGNISGVL